MIQQTAPEYRQSSDSGPLKMLAKEQSAPNIDVQYFFFTKPSFISEEEKWQVSLKLLFISGFVVIC